MASSYLRFVRGLPALLGGLLAIGLGASLVARPWRATSPPGTHLLEHGQRHWQGWIELVPAILTPRTNLGIDFTRVFVRLPRHGQVTLVGPERTALRVPAGAVVDRVEYRRVEGVWRAIDVRGTEFVEGGGELFHAYRAHSPKHTDALFGMRWSRRDTRAAKNAKAFMGAAMRDGLGFPPHGHREEERHARYLRLLQCASCHGYQSPERATGSDDWPRRATDASGLYTVLATLANESMTETYRPRNPNEQRRHVSYLCGDESHPVRRQGWPRCSDGSVPRARLDVARALAARDRHTRALCESRRALAAHLSVSVRHMYAAELRDCGIDTALEPETTTEIELARE